jgi:hypothetical protein
MTLRALSLIIAGQTLAQAAILMRAAPVILSPGNYFQALQGGVANGVDHAVVIAAGKEHLPMDFAALGAAFAEDLAKLFPLTLSP